METMDISVQELKSKLEQKEDFLFIDVREQHEYDEFNLGAELRPLNTLITNLDEWEDYKDKEIVVHCRSGARSGMAQQYMEASGFQNVRNLTGGVLAWVDVYGS